MLSTLPCSGFLYLQFWHGVIPTSYYTCNREHLHNIEGCLVQHCVWFFFLPWMGISVAYPGFARGGCPKYYAHAHNVTGRGPAHGSHAPQTRDQDRSIDRPVNSALCVRVASARAYPRVFLAFVGFRWPPTGIPSLDLSSDPRN